MTTKYTKDMSDSEVLKKMDKMFSQIEPDLNMKKTHCSFIAKSGKRHCLMTTLKSCQKCKFFTPTTQSKIRILVEHLISAEKDNRSLKADLTRCQNQIHEMKLQIRILEQLNDERRIREDNTDDKGVLPEGDEPVCQ